MILGLSLTALAQDGPKHPKNQERKGPPKEFFKKYDTNKDGKLDKEERSKISPKDKKKFAPPLRGPKGPHLPKKNVKNIIDYLPQ